MTTIPSEPQKEEGIGTAGATEIIRAWCASCGFANPSNGDCIALAAALSNSVPQNLIKQISMTTAVPELLVERQRAELCHEVTIPGDKWRAHLDGFIAARKAADAKASLLNSIEFIASECSKNGCGGDYAIDQIADLFNSPGSTQ